LVSTHVLMPCVGLWVSFPGFVWERWLEKESALAILSNGYRANRLIQLAGEEVYWEEVWKRCELDNLFGKLLIEAALLFELLCKKWEQLLCNFSWTKWYPKQFEVFVQLMAADRNPKNSSRSEKTATETHKHVPGCLLNLRNCANPR
jgi:hypothetical protein